MKNLQNMERGGRGIFKGNIHLPEETQEKTTEGLIQNSSTNIRLEHLPQTSLDRYSLLEEINDE
jgi:hypothetical protein